MSELQLPLRRWAAWCPVASTIREWENAAQCGTRFGDDILPDARHIPPMLRRRCSNFTRAAIAITHQCLMAGELSEVRTIFSSRHGEIGVTRNLLRQLAADEALSPMGFGLSVHNAGSGILSIQTKNTKFSTALAARGREVTSGLIEAAGLLRDDPEIPVLLIIADEVLPKEFHATANEWYPYYAAAFLFDPRAPHSLWINLRSALPEEPLRDGLHCLDFIGWLLDGTPALGIRERGQAFRFRKESSLRDLFADHVEPA